MLLLLRIKLNVIKNFLSLEEVKKFILNEEPESLSDTSPREVLIDLFRDM